MDGQENNDPDAGADAPEAKLDSHVDALDEQNP
jgi:hypothetical protein